MPLLARLGSVCPTNLWPGLPLPLTPQPRPLSRPPQCVDGRGNPTGPMHHVGIFKAEGWFMTGAEVGVANAPKVTPEQT